MQFLSRLAGLRRHLTKQNTDAFLVSPRFCVAVMILAALSNMFSLELPVYTVFIALAVYVCIWGQDLLPLMPLIVACYLSPSTANNPGKAVDSVFSFAQGGIWLAILAGAVAAALAFRVWKDRKAFFHAPRRLLPGILLLCGSYLLSGLGSTGYCDSFFSNLLFALMQCGCILLPYFLFTGGIQWKSVRKDYFAWLGSCVAGLLVVEILWVYLTQGVLTGGVIDRARIHTGWGMYNNMGAMLMILLPFPFYLTAQKNKHWLGPLIGCGHVLAVLLTCSRNSILVAGALYVLCVIWSWRRADKTLYRKTLLWLVGCAGAVCLLLLKPLLDAFTQILEQGLDLSSRDDIFKEGLKLFGQAPVFGVSFYSPGYQPWDWSTLESFTGLFPPRWHNTYVQLLASGGVVAMGAYICHRVQTAKLFLKQSSREKTAIALSLGALCFSSIFDCHFFNMGPVLFYSMGLAFAECICKSQVPRRK